MFKRYFEWKIKFIKALFKNYNSKWKIKLMKSCNVWLILIQDEINVGCNCSPLLPILIVTPRACPHHYLVAMSPPSIEENQRDTTILMFLTICHLTQIYSKCWYVRLLSRWETCITESFAKTRKSSIVYGYIKFKEIVCWPNTIYIKIWILAINYDLF